MRTDLHTHTTASDGALAPADLVAQAAEAGIQWLAVTDHDTLAGLPEARIAADDHGVELLTGIELSLTIGGTAIHVLGYGFDPEHESLLEYVSGFVADRRQRAEGMLRRLRNLGVPPLKIDQMDADGLIARPHIAAALVEVGAVDSYGSAFRKYIGDGRPAFVAMPDRPAVHAIRCLHDAGGIAILAHPGHWTSHADIERLISVGLDGIEAWHPMHDETLIAYYEKLTTRLGLLATGGSDYHGRGTQFGEWSLPEPACHRLRERLSLALPAS